MDSVAPGDTLVVTGRLVDTRCYAADDGNLHDDHPAPVPHDHDGVSCARFCAMQGFPVGITATDRQEDVWILLYTPQVLADYADRVVEVTGIVRSPGVLIPDRVRMRTADGAWQFIL